MFRQEDFKRCYPDIDISPLQPTKKLSSNNLMSITDRVPRHRRSYSSGMNLLDDTSVSEEQMKDWLPVQPSRRITMKHGGPLDPVEQPQEGKNNKIRRRSYSSGMLCLADGDASTLTEPVSPKAPQRQRSRGDDCVGNLRRSSTMDGPLPTLPQRQLSRDKCETWKDRKENSARSLLCLASADVPKRPSVAEEQERLKQEIEKVKKERAERRSRRRSQETTEQQPQQRRRHKSCDDMRSRMIQQEEEMGRKVIYANPRSPIDTDSFSRRARESEGRRGRSREPPFLTGTTRREQGIPNAIKVVRRGRSCGGRIPQSIVIETPEPSENTSDYLIRNTSFERSDSNSPTDDESTSSSSSMDDEIDDFDEESLALGQMFTRSGGVHVDKDLCNQTQVSALTTDMAGNSDHGAHCHRTHVSALTTPDMCWANSDGSVRSTSSPENREAIERSIKVAMASLAGNSHTSSRPSSISGSSNDHNNSHSSGLQHMQEQHTQLELLQMQQQQQLQMQQLQMHQPHQLLMQQQQQLLLQQQQQNQELFGMHHQQGLDDSKQTQTTAPVSADCGGSVYSAVSGVSHLHLNMTRPWICLCGEDNEGGFKFCGMCGNPEKWTCSSCNFTRNKNRSPHCGGCGLRRGGGAGGGGAAPMGDNSIRSQRSTMMSPTINPYGLGAHGMPMGNQHIPMGDNSIRSQGSAMMMQQQGMTTTGSNMLPMGDNSIHSQHSTMMPTINQYGPTATGGAMSLMGNNSFRSHRLAAPLNQGGPIPMVDNSNHSQKSIPRKPSTGSLGRHNSIRTQSSAATRDPSVFI